MKLNDAGFSLSFKEIDKRLYYTTAARLPASHPRGERTGTTDALTTLSSFHGCDCENTDSEFWPVCSFFARGQCPSPEHRLGTFKDFISEMCIATDFFVCNCEALKTLPVLAAAAAQPYPALFLRLSLQGEGGCEGGRAYSNELLPRSSPGRARQGGPCAALPCP